MLTAHFDSMKIWDDAGERYLSSVGKTAENGLSEKLCDMSLTEGAEYMKKQYALSFSTDEIVSGVLKIIEDFYFYEVGLKTMQKKFCSFGIEQYQNDYCNIKRQNAY